MTRKDVLIIQAPFLMTKENIEKTYNQFIKQMESGLLMLPSGYTVIQCSKDIDVIVEQQPCEDAISRSDAIRVASGYCHWSNIPKELAKLPSVNPIPCEDAISRQAAIDEVKRLFEMGECYCDRASIVGMLNSMPSVSTEKTGRWIDTGSGQECSNCHEIQHGYDNHRLYCANCGSRMTGVEE